MCLPAEFLQYTAAQVTGTAAPVPSEWLPQCHRNACPDRAGIRSPAVPVPAVTPRAEVEDPAAPRIRALDLANRVHPAPSRKLAGPGEPVRHHRASNRVHPRTTEGSERRTPGPHLLQRARSCAPSTHGAKTAGASAADAQRAVTCPRPPPTAPRGQTRGTTSVAPGATNDSPGARAVQIYAV